VRFPVFGSNGAPSNSATNYGAIAGAGDAWNATENNVQMPLSDACTLTDFGMHLVAAPGGEASYKFTIRKNGIDTVATVTISGAAIDATAWKGEVSFAAGDLISVSCVPLGTPTATGTTSPYIYLATTGSTFLLMGGSNSFLSNSSTQFQNPSHHTGQGWSTGETNNLEIVVPMSCTVTKLAVQLNSNAGGVGKGYAISGRRNATSDFLTATIEGGSATAASAAGSQELTPGDSLSIKAVPSGTPSARFAAFCMSITPAVEGESFVGYGKSATGSTSATEYDRPYGANTAAWNAAESERATYPLALTVRKFYIKIGTAPGASKKRTYTIRSNGADTAAKVVLEGASTTGSYTAGDVAITANAMFDVGAVPSSTPAANTGGNRWGFVIFTNQTAPLSLGAAAGQAAGTLGASAPVQTPLGAATGFSAAVLGISAATALVSVLSSAQSGASLGVAAARPLPLSPATAQSTGALGVTIPARLPVLTAAGAAGFSVPLLYGAELLFSPELLFGGAATTLILTVQAQLSPDPARGQSGATLGLTAMPEFDLYSTGQSGGSLGPPTVAKPLGFSPSEGHGAGTLGPIAAQTYVVLNPSFGQSGASLGVAVASYVGLGLSLGRSTATLGLTGTGALILAPSEGQSGGTLGVKAQTFLPVLSSSAASEGQMLFSVPVFLALEASTGESSATLGLTSDSMLALATAAGVSTATMAGAIFHGLELIDQGRDGHIDGGTVGVIHRGRIGDASWDI
jgi:hypothetical protein